MRPFEAEQSAGSVHFYVKMAATCSRSYASPLGAAKKKRRSRSKFADAVVCPNSEPTRKLLLYRWARPAHTTHTL